MVWICGFVQKEDKIRAGEKHIPINYTDVTEKDKKFISNIKSGCYNLDDFKVLSILNKIFLLNKCDVENLKEEHYEVLEQLSNVDELVNPVYISIDDEGVILVD